MSQPSRTSQPAHTAIPGPQGYPLVGIIPKLGRDVLGYFVSLMEDYGDLIRMDLGPRDLYLLTHPEGVKYVLQDNNRNYAKGYDQVKPVLGEGLVSSEGEFWRRQRRLIQPTFHRQRIEGFSRTMVASTAEMLDEWEPYARTGEPFDLAREMMVLTQRIIARTMFSTEVGEQTDTLCATFDVVLEYLNQRMFNPFPLFERLPTPTNIRFRRALQTLDEIMYDLIDRRRNDPHPPEDLLTMLLQARDEETGAGMDDRQIRDEVVTIFFAGHETTATTLAWTWYLLGQHPDIMAKLQAEVDQVLNGSQPSMESFAQLSYTRLVIDEALRIYPPAWMFARTALQADEVCGYLVPAGAMILLSPYVTHRHPDFWEQPEAFDPLRFTAERSKGRHRMAYFPFGGGPRLCIGKDFALVEAALLMAMMAQRYGLSLVAGQRVVAQPIATLRPQPGVSVTIQAR